jgi:predicted ATPase
MIARRGAIHGAGGPPGRRAFGRPIGPCRAGERSRRLIGLQLAEPGDCIGREREIADLVRLAGSTRLITLCGPAGVGKTRLLGAVTAALAGRYPDGACLARLDNLREPDLTAAQLAKAAGICEEPGVPIADTLTEALRDRAMLLALDGCDAVAGACGALCQRLLEAAPGLLVLAGSREPLGAAAEMAWAVPPLAVPRDAAPASAGSTSPGDASAGAASAGSTGPGDADPGDASGGSISLGDADSGDASPVDAAGAGGASPGPCGATLLFAERAGTAAMGDGGAASARAICRRAGGMPLAIELAAARARQVGAAHVRASLDALLGPAPGQPAGPEESMRAVLAWTWTLLAPAEQVLLRRLSVFATWSVEMAERVCSDGQLPAFQVYGLVSRLASAGLAEAGTEPDRYRLPGAVRDYAAARLAEAGEADKLGHLLREYAVQRVTYLLSIGSRVPASWTVLTEVVISYEADISNIRAALAWWREHGDAAPGLRVCAELANYWIGVGTIGEGCWWLDAFLDARLPPVPDAVRGPALVGRSLLAYDSGDYQRAEECAAEGLRLCQAGDGRRIAAALDMLSRTAMGKGRAEEALWYATESVEQCSRSGDAWNHGFALGSRAYALAALGRVQEAMEATADGLHLMQSISNQWGAALFQVGIGDIARALGDYAGAREYFLAALPFMRDAMPAPHAADCLARVGSVDIRLGDLDAAREHLAESLRLGLAAGHRPVIARSLLSLATLEVREGHADRALTLAAAATTQCLAAQLPPPPAGRVQRYRAEAAALGEPEITRRWAAGLAMTSRAAAEYALSPPEPAP